MVTPTLFFTGFYKLWISGIKLWINRLNWGKLVNLFGFSLHHFVPFEVLFIKNIHHISQSHHLSDNNLLIIFYPQHAVDKAPGKQTPYGRLIQ